MTAESFLPGTPTPCQIENHIAQAKLLESLIRKIGLPVPPDLLKSIVLEGGTILYYKFYRFRSSANEVVRAYGEDVLMDLDEDCVTKSGRINRKKLRKRLNGSKVE